MPVFKLVNIYNSGTNIIRDYEVDFVDNHERAGGVLRLTAEYRGDILADAYGTITIDTDQYGERISFQLALDDVERLLTGDGHHNLNPKGRNNNV